MASINKLHFCLDHINSRLSLTVCVLLLLHFNYSTVWAHSGILSHNEKYTNRQRLFSVAVPDLDINVNNVWAQTLQLQGHRHDIDRVKRETKDQASSSSSNLKDKTKVPDGNNALLEESKIQFSPSVLDGTQNSSHAFIHWVGKAHDSERIFILTCRTNFSSGYWHVEESQMWWSQDYGTSFQKKDFHGANISYFYTFPANEKKLLFTDVEGKKIYTTKDELKTYSPVDVPVEPDIVLPHPTNEDHILLYGLLQRKLYFSSDFGTTWNLFAENVLPNFYWGQKGFDNDVNVVHMEIEAPMPTHSKYKVCAVPNCLEVESGANDVRPFLANTLVVHKEYMFVKTSNADESDATLLVSYMRGPFEQAHFPGNVKTNDFIFLNLDDGQVFIAVNHEDHVNLYLSDATGHFFVLSFSNIYHIPRVNWFEIDFHEVKGMNWTFLANRRDESTKAVTTYISFDKGGNWAPLVVDEELKKSCNIVDKKNCSLELHIKQSDILASVMSQENAPGIILAHGYLGSAATKYLSQEVSVFSSRDGGVTWKKAPFSGTYRFNILDQGSILTAVSDGIFTSFMTNIMHFSCDEGLTWRQTTFDAHGVIVKGVLTEPGILTLVESIFGHKGIGQQPWTVIKADFGKVLKRKCESNDYEEWTPRDPKRDSKCIMGLHMKFKRRKQSASCYNDVVFIQRVSHNDTCDCTDEDFECDFGYHESEVNDRCVKSDWYYDGYLPVVCEDGQTYKKSTGYRKVASDACYIKSKSAEEHFVPTDAKCPSVLPHGLKLVAESQSIATGKEAVFHLHQAGGSEISVTYTWDFGDSGTSQEDGFKNATSKSHIYKVPGTYNVTVTAANSKGKAKTSLIIHVYDRIHDMHIIAPWAGQSAQPLKVTILVQMTSQVMKENSEFLHFVWRFGDEVKCPLFV